MFSPATALVLARSRVLAETDPTTPGATTPGITLQEGLDSTGRWFDALITPAWQIALTIAIGAIALALLRRFIARTVRHLVEGGPAMTRRAGNAISARLRQDGQSDVSPLAAARRAQRAQTMGSALSSGATFFVGALVVVIVLGILQVDVGPLLASAGVVGVALGFGAQTLVKDFLAGISMLAEDQYGVGDVVDVGEASGVVEQGS